MCLAVLSVLRPLYFRYGDGDKDGLGWCLDGFYHKTCTALIPWYVVLASIVRDGNGSEEVDDMRRMGQGEKVYKGLLPSHGNQASHILFEIFPRHRPVTFCSGH